LYPWGKYDKMGLFAAGVGGSRMLFRWAVMLSLAVLGLSLAACAEMGEAMAASVAEQAAEVAATQVAIATTQTVDKLEAAASQMSDQVENGTMQPVNLPSLPPVGKGTLIIYSPKVVIIQTNGKRYILLRHSPVVDQDSNH
jgi:hypothetical protein